MMGRRFATWVLVVSAAAGLTSAPSMAQHITIDGSLVPGTAGALIGPNYTIGANLGKQVGGNLFQSFGIFGLSTGENANFTGPATVTNVIGRVTGGFPSSINGQIQSQITGANVYLINPSGIVFGPTATINVSGSFHASTADYLRLADGAKFQATNPSGSTFSAAAPAAFGFVNPSPPAITVNGSTLAVPGPGQTLGLVGGPVTVTAAQLSAPSGTIHIASAASAGEIPVTPGSGVPATVTAHGTVQINEGSLLQVSNPTFFGPAGNVSVYAGTLTVDASEIEADNYSAASGGKIRLSADSQINVQDSSFILSHSYASGPGADIVLKTGPSGGITIDGSSVDVSNLSSGAGGRVSLTTGQLDVVDDGTVASSAGGTGTGGVISVNAQTLLLNSGLVFSETASGSPGGAITISAQTVQMQSGSVIESDAESTGAGGAITVSASLQMQGGVIQSFADNSGAGGAISVSGQSLQMTSGAIIEANTNGVGAGGAVTVNITGPILIDGTLTPTSETAILTTGEFAPAGNLSVSAGSLTVNSNGAVASFSYGPSNAGNVTVSVNGALAIDGTYYNGAYFFPYYFTGIFSEAEPNSTGNGGAVTVTAGSIDVTNNGVILSGTLGNGNPGAVAVTSPGTITLDGTLAQISTGIASGSFGSGDGGPIAVNAGNLTIISNGTIVSGSYSSGNGGSIDVNVTGLLSIDGSLSSTALISLSGVGSFTGISSGSFGNGKAGDITVNAGALSMVNDGIIVSGTYNSGQGGSVTVNVTGAITIVSTPLLANDITGIDTQTNGFDPQTNMYSSGNAGTIKVTAASLTIGAYGTIESNSYGSGSAGNIVANIAGALSIDGAGASINSKAFAVPSPIGGAGVINVTSGSLTVADGADISTDTYRPENAGDLTVTTGSVSLSDFGTISSRTFGSGAGGTVLVNVSGPLSIDNASIGVDTDGSGNAGSLTVNAGSLSLIGGGIISGSTESVGNGGSVVVNVAGLLSIDGSGLGSGISAIAGLGSTGNAGSVAVSAGSLQMVNGGEIASNTFGPGNGGSVVVNVAGAGSLSSGAAIDANAENISTGNGGSVSISAASLSLSDNGAISSSTFSSGSGGDVSVNVFGPLSITDGGFIAAGTLGSGNGGNIQVTAGSIQLSGESALGLSAISASALPGATGNAGNVTVNGGSIAIATGGQVSSTTDGPGQGGDIEVEGQSIQLSGPGPEITAQSGGTGNAGSITVNAGNLTLTQGASISTEAAQANGGDITLNINHLLLLVDSEISTSVNGALGNGGNILIDPPFVVLDASDIIAQAVGGNGGNITIIADEFIKTPDSLISATSTLGISGAIDISSPVVQISGALATLTGELRAADVVARDNCSERGNQPRSSFVSAGRGGLTQDPDSVLPALYVAGRDLGTDHVQNSMNLDGLSTLNLAALTATSCK
jgi:filamentous hemagglutinin family protein